MKQIIEQIIEQTISLDEIFRFSPNYCQCVIRSFGVNYWIITNNTGKTWSSYVEDEKKKYMLSEDSTKEEAIQAINDFYNKGLF